MNITEILSPKVGFEVVFVRYAPIEHDREMALGNSAITGQMKSLPLRDLGSSWDEHGLASSVP